MQNSTLPLAPLTLWMATLALLSQACDGGGAFDGSADAGEDITYYDHIQPLFAERCVGCHHRGSIAPLELGTYEQVRAMGERVRAAVIERIMPPFLADDSGSCNHWSNSIALSDAEISLVDRWVELGMLQGEPRPAPTPPTLPSLPSVDMTLEIPEYTIDEASTDDYRCFVIETGVEARRFVTGYDVIPGNAERVHHLVVFNPVDATDGEAARRRDADTPGEGYTCFGGAGVNASPLVVWAPGGGATRFPRGTGIAIEPGRPLIVQIHYNNIVDGSPNTDHSRVEFSIAEAATEAHIFPIWNLGIELPPGLAEVTESRTTTIPGVPIPLRIWGAFPHMHTIGRSLRVDLHLEGEGDRCLINVPRWDFNWQSAFWLREPIRVRTGDRATITCTYDTRSRRETTRWGEGTMDEMCLNFVYISP